MTLNAVQNERIFKTTLVSALSQGQRSTPPTRAEVEELAGRLAEITGYDGDVKAVVEEALIAVETRMGAGVSLVDPEAEHDEEWVLKREIPWTYSEAYEGYLRDQGWPASLVQSLTDVGTRILGHLQDPLSEGSWDRRGLVLGHVQSGKTANYMGLIAKAADAGYKFIIVIAGIHNNLRKQTQERIDEGFVGRSSDPESHAPVGVGLNGHYPHPATLTNIYDDFNKKTAGQSGWKLNDFSKPIIIVIKKNVRTLDALHKWLKEMNARGDNERIGDVPMLLIDDEADNASVNTNKPDLDPTRTNAMIRRILSLFDKSCYVGYTATPFANIFINPEAYDQEVYDELFPRDFIYCLDAPNTYFGPNKVFLDETSSEQITRPIWDCEEYIPLKHKKDDEVPELPPSLYEAVNTFILARVIRNLRGQENRHCSMMINVSRFVDVQRKVRDFISIYEKRLREAVKANYAMPEEVSSKNRYMQKLKETFLREYADCGFGWDEVRAALYGAFANLRTYVVNSKSDEVLDYRRYEQDGQGLTAIAIGGLSLSRGLTIEGLCVSYMYRNTRMYDTLMQMGRWFGYRPGYEDVCRVWLSPDSISWYGHIADASEELRQQIKRMRRDRLSPKQFGLYVRAHPDSLLITAANKMRAGEKVHVKQNFSGRLLESFILPTDDQINHDNEELIAEYWRGRFGGKSVEKTEKGWIVKNAPLDSIEEFLNRFQCHPGFVQRKYDIVNYLQNISERYSGGDVLLISIAANDEDPANYRLGLQGRPSARREKNGWRMAKDRVASRGDEKLGLTADQVEDAAREASNDPTRKSDRPSDIHFRTVRNKPLLMLHVLGPVGSPDAGNRVPAFGVSFPPGHYDTEIEIVANTVWIEQMQGAAFDTPDEEEDYDE